MDVWSDLILPEFLGTMMLLLLVPVCGQCHPAQDEG